MRLSIIFLCCSYVKYNGLMFFSDKNNYYELYICYCLDFGIPLPWDPDYIGGSVHAVHNPELM